MTSHASSAAVPPRRDASAPTGRRTIDVAGFDDLQILAPDGTVDESLVPDLTDDELRRVHRAMVLTRVLDKRMLNMQRQGRMGTFAPGLGQEATQIGQVHPLRAEDWFSPSYRSFGAQLWRGWPIDQLLLLWDGYFEGFAPPPGVNDLPFSIVIGSHVPVAVGVSMGMQYMQDDAVMLVNFGDGAMSQGIVAESFNFAATSKAPVVFVCENNGWAISMPATEQAATHELAVRGVGFGIPSIRVDGNDVLAMIVATTHAVQHARSGKGPFLVEAVTYRMSVHTTADDPKVYRDESEVEAWTARCPIARLEKHLADRGVLDADAIAEVAASCDQEVLAARDAFRERAAADPFEVFDYVYETRPPELEAQRAEYLEKLRRKGIEPA